MTHRRRRLAAGLVAACFVAVPASAQAQNIPTPEQHFGFKMGAEGKLPTWSKTKEYFKLIGDRSSKVDYFVEGKTTEGDDYPYLIISSPRNMGRLGQIMEANAKLSSARGLSAEAAAELAETTKPVYLIESMMHSSEVANMPAVVDIVHRFASENSPYTREVLNNAVIVVIPAANPDGWRKMADHFAATANTNFTRTFPDLYHHFAGHDNNRDWFLFTQKETQHRIRINQRFNPVVEHFMHQQGATGSRIFVPPWAEPVSPNLDPIAHESGNALGLEIGKYLTADGFKGVQHSMGTQNSYGIMYSADVATYGSWRGSSLLLTETASQRDLAYPFSNGNPLGPQGRSMDVPDPYRGTTWTLEQASEYAKAALYYGVRSIARNGQDWLVNSLYRTTSKSLAGWEGAPYAYVLPAGQRDPYAVYEMLHTFELAKVEIDRATAPFTAGGKNYAAGSYILRTQQPLGRFVNQLLDDATYPNWARPCASCPLTMPYSEFTDRTPLLFGFTADPIAASFTAATERVAEVKPESVLLPQPPPATGAYLVPPGSYGIAKLLGSLQQWDVPTFRAGAAFNAGGREFAPGTVIVPPTARARMVLDETQKAIGLAVHAVDQTPEVAGFKLKPGTRIGLIRGANNMPGGWLMWTLEHFGMEYEVVSADDYDKLDALYDAIILAPGINRARIVDGLDPARNPQEFHWARGVGEQGWSQLAAFVRNGGTLLGLGSASETAQQLLNLPISRVGTVQPFRIGGSLLRETFDTTQPAAWGLPSDWVTYFNGDRAFNVSGNAKVVGAYPGTGNMLASGYEEGAEQLRGKADVVSMNVDQGWVTVVGSQSTWRSWPRSLWPLVSNTVYHGPSEAVSGPELKALTAAAWAAENPGAEPEPETPPTVSTPDVKAAVATPAAPAPAGAVAESAAAKVTVSCKLAKSKRAVTCTIKGAKGSKLRADLAFGKAKARRSGNGTVTVTLRVDRRLKATSKIAVKVTSGKTAGTVKARAGRRASVTMS